MKRFALLAATAAIAVPVIAAPVAMAGITSTAPDGTAIPNTTKKVSVAAGSTTQVALGKVNSGTGYSWRWITKPDASIAQGLNVRTSKASKPGAPVNVTVGVKGVSAGKPATGQLGYYAPGATSPNKTTTLNITVVLAK